MPKPLDEQLKEELRKSGLRWDRMYADLSGREKRRINLDIRCEIRDDGEVLKL